jgi:hypothetical protein
MTGREPPKEARFPKIKDIILSGRYRDGNSWDIGQRISLTTDVLH